MPRVPERERIARNRVKMLETVRIITTDPESGCRIWDGKIIDGVPWSADLAGPVHQALAGVPIGDELLPVPSCGNPLCVSPDHVPQIDFLSVKSERTAQRMSKAAADRWARYRELRSEKTEKVKREQDERLIQEIGGDRLQLHRRHQAQIDELFRNINRERLEVDLPLTNPPRLRVR